MSLLLTPWTLHCCESPEIGPFHNSFEPSMRTIHSSVPHPDSFPFSLGVSHIDRSMYSFPEPSFYSSQLVETACTTVYSWNHSNITPTNAEMKYTPIP